jgi:hypothetical protein
MPRKGRKLKGARENKVSLSVVELKPGVGAAQPGTAVQ